MNSIKVILATAPRAIGEIEMAGLPFLGIGYIASYLEKYGPHDVAIVDAHSENLTPNQTVEKILAFNPDVVGFTCTTHNRLQTIETIKLLKQKKPSVMVMVGGQFFSLAAENTLNTVKEIDVVVRREGEVAAKELIDAWPERNKMANILGITYRGTNEEIISNPDRPFMNDWTKLPFPAWHLYDLNKYDKKMHGTDFRTIGVISARGCPNRCTFCCNAAYGLSSLRLREPKNFVDELEMLKNKYGFEAFNIWDDTLTVIKKHVMDICDEILKRNLNIKWYARARVNTVDEEMIKKMREAGCIRISFGVESGSPRMLKIIKKNITLDQVRKAVKLCSDAGMMVSLNFIVNLPTQTWEDLKMSADLIKELNKYPNTSCSYGFALLYPGTEMTSFAEENGILPKNFSWNSPYKTEKYRITKEDPSVPYMEWPGMELEKVKAFMVRELNTKSDLFKKGLQRFKKVKSFDELKSLLKTSFRYLKTR